MPTLRFQQKFSRSPADVFPFFADERNLERITPPWLNFRVLGKSTPEMREGTRIDYRLKVHGVPISWQSEIQEWSPNRKFVDTQTRGPYGRWHHQHIFEAVEGGTLMTDILSYEVPLGWLGRIVAGALVRRDVEGIFEYRRREIEKIFS